MHEFLAPLPGPDALWEGRYKIPWDDPDFSRRMLAFHLAEEHDMASRRGAKVRALCTWIHDGLCGGEPASILDLGCGPGLYMAQLVARGHRLRGIDFGPASVAHAREILPPDCTVEQGDLREIDFGRDHDLILMLYGELNVFSPDECRRLLRKAHEALEPGGRLLFEVYTVEGARAIGESPGSWTVAETGLWSDRPHVCLVENHWLEAAATSLQRFHVQILGEATWRCHRSTTKAWRDDEWPVLAAEAGFAACRPRDGAPATDEPFRFWEALRAR